MRLLTIIAAALAGAAGCACSDDPAISASAEDRAEGAGVEAPPPERAEAPISGDLPAAPSTSSTPGDLTAVDEQAADGETERPRARPAKRKSAASVKDGARPRAGDGGDEVKGAPEDGQLDADIKVKRFVIASDVVDREPVQASTVYSKAATERVYAFVEVDNPALVKTELSVVFVPPGQPSFPVALSIGPLKRYRTWAYTRKLGAVGAWRVEVRGGDVVLATTSFELTE